MSAPYRDAPPAAESEPTPNLGVDRNLWPTVWMNAALFGGWALAAAREDIEMAKVVLVMGVPAVIFYILLAALYEPVGRWLERRRARAIIEGVAALEAKVSARE
jgi:hypothetical protein